MSVNRDAPEGVQPESEAPLFAPTPIWAQDPKARRRARAGVAPRRTDPALDAGEAGVMGATEPADAAYETQPARPARRSAGPAALAAGVAVVALAAAAGWYVANRPHDTGMAQLTPGQATVRTPIGTPANNATPPGAGQMPLTRVSDQSKGAGATEAVTKNDRPTTTTHVRRSKARPASAMDSSVAASATVLDRGANTAPAPAAPPTATTNLSPLSGSTSPVPPAATPSASSAEPGASPAATPAPTTTP